MRKFKTSKIDDEKFNQKFEEDLKEIKEKLHAEKPSDEFKQNLQAILEEELNKTSDKKERKFHFPIYAKKLAAVCACLIIFFSGCFTFADDIENVILELFGNTDKIIENAIVNGDYQKVNMEYIKDNDISIKIDYVVKKEKELYVVFDVLTKEEFDQIYFEDIIFKVRNDFVLYNKIGRKNNSKVVFDEKRVERDKFLIITKITEIEEHLIDFNNINVEIREIKCLKESAINLEKGCWKFEIDIK